MDSGRPRLSRAWTTDDGARIRLETRSYTNPLFAVHEDSSTSHHAASQSRRPSLFRTAFSLLNAVHDLRRERMRQQEPEDYVMRNDRRSRADFTRSTLADDSRSDIHDQYARTPSERCDPRHERRAGEYSPPRPSRRKHRRRDVSRDKRTASDHDGTNEYSTRIHQRTTHSPVDGTHIQVLEQRVFSEQRDVKKCSLWLQSHAHEDDVSDRLIQDMVMQLQHHKQHLKDAKAALRAALDQVDAQEQAQERPRTPRRRHSTQNNNRAEAAEMPPGLGDLFDIFLRGSLPHASSRNRPPFPSHSDLFNRMFADMTADGHFVFTTSQDNQARTSNSAHDFFTEYLDQEDFRPQAATSSIPSRRKIPVPGQLLSIPEAKALYKAYNDQWTSIAPSDPEIPYPGRDLQSAALTNRKTVWAPTVSSPVATWSVEDVVRANAQAFFLAATDFSPVFTDQLHKIEMDFDHSKAAPGQLQLLIDMLKKEKLRWHSDRLGRRNGGKPGTNEALQQHQVARGIFHAICELSDLAASKR